MHHDMSHAMTLSMPGGWTMSSTWTRPPGQSWPGAAAGFLAMWIAMMVAMMLPSLWPVLRSYRRAIAGRAPATRLFLLPLGVAAGYFAVWAAVGVAAYPPGAAVASLAMRHPTLSRAVPFAAALTLLLAGLFQLSPWKARQLACCRREATVGGAPPTAVGAAIRHGFALGLRCVLCCAAPTAALFALGVMDPGPMVLVTAAITAERLALHGIRVARAAGVVAIGTGAWLLARAAGLS